MQDEPTEQQIARRRGRPVDEMRNFYRENLFQQLPERTFARFWRAFTICRGIEAHANLTTEEGSEMWREWITLCCDDRGNINFSRLERLAEARAMFYVIEWEQAHCLPDGR